MEYETAGNVFFDEKKQLIFSCNKCASTFVRQQDFEAHSTQEHSKGWYNLDETCFFQIMKHLSPKDLVLFGQVCERFKKEAKQYVKLHNKTKSIGIYVYESGIRFKRRYEQFFRREISSVHVYFHCAPTRDLFTFIKCNCAEHWKMFGLTYCGDIDGDIDDTHIGIIKERLKNVEQLHLEDIKIADIHSTLLDKCENLRSLAITRSNTMKSDEDHEHCPCTAGTPARKRFKKMEEPKKWIVSPCENNFSEINVSEKYPKLKVLTFLTTSIVQWYDIDKFHYLNKSWRNYVHRHVQILKDICHSKVRLNVRLLTNFSVPNSDLKETPVKLHNFDVELVATQIDNFKHLKVVQFLGSISGIHTNARTLSAIIRANIVFPELKTLCVSPFIKNVVCRTGIHEELSDEGEEQELREDPDDSDENLQATELDRRFPNLTELFIHEATIEIKSIFRHFKRLEIFVCNSTAIRAYNLFELNCARSGLKDAKKVTLFNCKDILKRKNTHYISPLNSLVEVNSNDDKRCICKFLLD